MIDWTSENQVTSHPVLQNLSNEEILNAVDSPLPILEYQSYTSSRTNSTICTQTSSAVYGHDEREGLIIKTISNREILYIFQSKDCYF